MWFITGVAVGYAWARWIQPNHAHIQDAWADMRTRLPWIKRWFTDKNSV